MKIELRPLESVYWHSKPAYKLRYPAATVLLFLGSFVLLLGSFWEIVGTISLFLSLAFLGMSVWAIFSWTRGSYYLTSARLVSREGELELQDPGRCQRETVFAQLNTAHRRFILRIHYGKPAGVCPSQEPRIGKITSFSIPTHSAVKVARRQQSLYHKEPTMSFFTIRIAPYGQELPALC